MRPAATARPSSTTATSTRATISSSPTTCWATSSRSTCSIWWAPDFQQQVRPGQAGHAAEVLPRVRRALRLPRGVPEEPLRHHAGRRAGPELPVRRLQGLFPPRRPTHEDHDRSRAPRATPGTDVMQILAEEHSRQVAASAQQGGTQRTLPLRQRPEVQEMSRCGGARKPAIPIHWLTGA